MVSVSGRAKSVANDDLLEYEDLDVWSDLRSAIAQRYLETPGRLDIRRLWSDGLTHYFRVNWWKLRENLFERYICRSAFVIVEETEEGLTVSENAARVAA